MKNRNADLAILVLTVTACAIPFLGQPFHMDDGFYLDMARNAQKSPLFPNDTPYMFQGIVWSDLGSHSHGPMQTYYLAIILRFFGEGPGTERIYHSFALIFPILAVISFYWICALWVERPLWPAMLLACSPLFLVTQHTLMTDVPMLAFWLASIASFVWAVHRGRTVLYGLSAVFQVAAVFTSFQSLALLPLLGFYLIRKSRKRSGWVTLSIAPVAISVWYLVNCIHYGRPLWEKTLGYMQSRSPLSPDVLWIKLASILEYQGWLVIFPFFIFYVLGRGLRWRALILATLGAVYLAQFSVPEYGWKEKGIFVVGIVSGFFSVLEMGRVAWNAFRPGDSAASEDRVGLQFLALWYFGFFCYCLLFLTEGSARYILPMLPPFLLCFVRLLERSEIPEYRLPRRFLNSAMAASGSLVLSLAWGLVLSRADQEFAGIYPRFAAEFGRVAGRLDAYSSGEWGFRYYLGRTGAQPLPADSSRVHGGSMIAIPKLAQPNEIPPDLRSMLIPVQTSVYTPDTPFRVLERQSHAGFWSSGWGLIPFSFSRQNLEQIEIFQTNFMVEQLPWAQVETAAEIKPWPGYLALNGQSHLSILAMPGTQLRYAWPGRDSMLLDLHCGISPESYEDGSAGSYEFAVRQLTDDGIVLAEQRLTLEPGMRKADRQWRALRLTLQQAGKGFIYFTYRGSDGVPRGMGAFAQPMLRPVH